MTTYTSAIVTLDSIIEGLFLKGDIPEGYEAKIKQIAIEGYRELNLVSLPNGNEVRKFTMDSNYIVYLPDDVSLVNSVSVPCEGKMWTLTLERDMIPTTSESGGSEILDSDNWGEGDDIIKRGTGYSSTGGVNLEGYYYVDYPKRRILFRNVSRSDVLVDFLHSGVDLQETTYVPAYAKAALEAFIWLYLEYNKSMPHPNNIGLYRDEYERQKAIIRGVKFNMVDFRDAIYRTLTASIFR